MSQVPADLDQTMWEIAERSDQKAAGDFSEKFPDLAASMAARMQMVSGMREMRGALAPSFVPPFKPKFMYKPKPVWVRFGPMALGLAALAGASCYITWNMTTPLPTPESLNPNKRALPNSQNTAPITLPQDPAVPTTEQPMPFSASPNVDFPTKHVTMTNIKLQDAILAVARQAHLTVEPFPNDFPNPTVKVDLTGKPGMDLLQRLGQKEGFTAIPDGNNQVIIIPSSAAEISSTDSNAKPDSASKPDGAGSK
jgi:hypothetical protein